MSLDSLLVQRALIERATTSLTAAGDALLSWQTAAAAVPCLIETIRIGTTLAPVGEITTAAVRGYFPADTDLRPAAGDAGADRVTVDGVVYSVTGVWRAAGPRGRLLVADLTATA